MEKDTPAITLHASAVALDGRAVLLTGASGAGKSALALDLISRGARLISDDQVHLIRQGSRIVLAPPTGAPPLIEARGIGLLDLGPTGRPAPPDAELSLIVDLESTEPNRLPPVRHRDLLGLSVPLVSGRGVPNLAPALTAILQGAVLQDPETPV